MALDIRSPNQPQQNIAPAPMPDPKEVAKTEAEAKGKKVDGEAKKAEVAETIAKPIVKEVDRVLQKGELIAELATTPVVEEKQLPTGDDLKRALDAFAKLNDVVGTKKPEGALAEFLALTQEDKPVAFTLEKYFTPAEIVSIVKLANQIEAGEIDPKTLKQEDLRNLNKADLIKAALVSAPKAEAVVKLTPQQEDAVKRLAPKIAEECVSFMKAGTPGKKQTDIEIPGPHIVAMEKSLSDFAGLDVDELCQIVMMEAAKSSETDLRELIDEMKKTNAQKEKLRAFTAKAKKQEAAAKSSMRKEYDRRCGMDKPLGINPKNVSFDDYCASQKLVMKGGSFAAGDDGMPMSNDLSMDVSPNFTYYRWDEDVKYTGSGAVISQADVDLAEKLGLDPEQVVKLHTLFSGEDNRQKRLDNNSDFEQWLVCELGVTAGGAQNANNIDKYLQTHDTSVIFEKLSGKFGVTKDDLTTLDIYWKSTMTAGDRQKFGDDFAKWLADSTDGPGLVAGGAKQSNKVTAFINKYNVAAKAEEDAIKYGVTVGEMKALKQYWQYLPTPRAPAVKISFEEFMRASPDETNPDGTPKGPGMLDSGEADGSTKVAAFFSKVSAGAALGGTTSPYSDSMISGLISEFGSYNSSKANNGQNRFTSDWSKDTRFNYDDRETAMYQQLNQMRDWLDNNANGGGAALDEKLKGLFNELLNASMNTLKFDPTPNPTQKMAELKAALDAIRPEELKATALGYVKVRMAEFDKDIRQGIELDKVPGREWWDFQFMPGIRSAFLDKEGGNQDGNKKVTGSDGKNDWFDPNAKQRVRDNMVGMFDSINAYGQNKQFKPVEDTHAADRGGVVSEFLKPNHGKFADAPVQQNTFTEVDTTVTPTETQSAIIKELKKKKDHSTPVAGHSEVGAEMTLDQLHAEIEAWEGKKDGLNEMSDTQSMRLQMYQERRSKYYQTLSNIMKKMSDTNQAIIGNMK